MEKVEIEGDDGDGAAAPAAAMDQDIAAPMRRVMTFSGACLSGYAVKRKHRAQKMLRDIARTVDQADMGAADMRPVR